MTTIWPVCFHEEIVESEVLQCETSNGIYISKQDFAKFMTDESGEFVALELQIGNMVAYCHIIGTHNNDDEMIFAPGWVCNMLGASGGEAVIVQRAYPSIGTKITIKPKNTKYAESADPVDELRNAFESYSCLIAGIEIPMLVNGETVDVGILDTSVAGPVCIRGVELEVEIASDPVKNIPEQSVPEQPFPEVKTNTFVGDTDFTNLDALIPLQQSGRFQGVGRVLGTGKRVYPENNHK